MKPVPVDLIEKTCEKMWRMSEKEAYRLTFDLEHQQPVLLAYLAAVDTELLNQDEREILFFNASLIWQIMLAANKNLPKISEDLLLACEAENLKLGESLKKADNVKFAGVIKSILKDYGQPELFRYVVAALLTEEEEDDLVRDENLGIIMLDLKTVIDCFDKLG
jgi:hypothetical protein